MTIGQGIATFFSQIWTGMGTVTLPYFNISLSSLLLGIFVVDFSISILYTIIRFYSGVSHTGSRISGGINKHRIRSEKSRRRKKGG